MKHGQIYEVAELSIVPGAEEAFEAAAPAALDVLAATPGCQAAYMLRGIERPEAPLLVIRWDSVQAHEDFRVSSDFAAYRAPIQEHFAAPPAFRHFEVGATAQR